MRELQDALRHEWPLFVFGGVIVVCVLFIFGVMFWMAFQGWRHRCGEGGEVDIDVDEVEVLDEST